MNSSVGTTMTEDALHEAGHGDRRHWPTTFDMLKGADVVWARRFIQTHAKQAELM